MLAEGTRPVASCAVDQAPSSPATDPFNPSPRADWYPDPTGRFEFRYHNGVSWTGDVSVDGERFLDPLRSPSVAVVPPGFTAVPFRQTSSSAKARAAFVLGLCSLLIGWVPFLCLLALAAAVVGLVFAVGVLRRDARDRRESGPLAAAQDRPGHSYAVAGLILAPLGLAASGIGVWLSVLTLREVQDFTDVGHYSTTDVSCDVGDGLATYTGTITNESSSVRSYDVTVEFVRPGTSVRLYIASTSVDDVEPGITATVVVNEVVSQPELECRLVGVTGPLPFGQS